MRVRKLVLLFACLLLSPSLAHAEDVWTQPHRGVRHLLRTVPGPNRINATFIDLRRPDVHARATRPEHRGRTVSSFAALYGTAVAINGDFFAGGFQATGMAVGDGVRWGGNDGPEQSFIAFGSDNRAEISHPWDIVAGPEAWMAQLVSGRELVTQDGVAAAYVAGNPDVAPRTAAGLTADGKTLILAVVDGRSTSSRGMTLLQLGQAMADLGAHWAINLDGGGSSAMVVDGNVVNRPSDGGERTVGNHLGVVITPLPAVDAKFIGQGSSAAPDPSGEAHFQLCTEEAVDFWFEVENVGEASWVDWGDTSPGAWGRAVRLGVPDDSADVFTSQGRVSLNGNANPDVHSIWGATSAAPCNDQALCGRTIFRMSGQAPSTPGTYRTTWRLVDELRAWFGPEMWLSFRVEDCEVKTDQPDSGVPDADDDVSVGCTISGDGGAGAWLFVLAAALVFRPRRAERARRKR